MSVRASILLATLLLVPACNDGDDDAAPPGPGALDPAFGSGGVVVRNATVGGDSLLGMVLLGESLFLCGAEGTQWRVEKRSATTGALDGAFGTGGALVYNTGSAVALAVDGSSLYVAGSDTSAGGGRWLIEKRDAATGSPDAAFGAGGAVSSNPSTEDDRPAAILVAGGGLFVCGGDRSSVMGLWRIEKRELLSGAYVAAFGTSGVVAFDPSGGAGGYPGAMATDGAALFIGGTQSDGTACRMEKRDLGTGVLDGAFGTGGAVVGSGGFGTSGSTYSGLAVDGGFIYSAGSLIQAFGPLALPTQTWRLEKRSVSTGVLDPAFGTISVDGGFGSSAALALVLDGASLFAAGQTGLGGADLQWRLEKRSRADGALDPAFGDGGAVTLNPGPFQDHARGVAAAGGSVIWAGNEFATVSDGAWRVESRLR